MDILIIAVLIIAAVILFLVELFVIPGISLAGISALVCILYANYYAFTNLGMAGGFWGGCLRSRQSGRSILIKNRCL